jgi:hypothetical protein
MITAHTSAAYLGANIPTGTAAPNTSIPRQPPLSELDRRLIDAFDRLAGGRSETTDGALTVTSLCAEARVSRASYYRSPVAAVVKRSWPPTRHPVLGPTNFANERGNWTRPARSSGGGTPRR